VRRYETGETLASIGLSRGLTRERVRQIVKLAGASVPRTSKCGVEDCHTAPRWPRIYCHAHQARFELLGDPHGSSPVVPLVPAEHGTTARYREGGCRCDLCRKASAGQRREHFHQAHPEWRYMPLKQGSEVAIRKGCPGYEPLRRCQELRSGRDCGVKTRVRSVARRVRRYRRGNSKVEFKHKLVDKAQP
jgi:hypothetical protein